MNKVIVNTAIGSYSSWYHKGQERLLHSLQSQGEQNDIYFSKQIIKCDNPYEEKVKHIKAAVDRGYRQVLWLDCSIQAIKPLEKMWDYIQTNGVYLYQSGANCAETCNDYCLKCYDVNRDEAELIPECASNVVGFDLDSTKGKIFYDWWIRSISNGAMNGIKWPTVEQRQRESKDIRFKYHRQDQSTASLAAYKAGCKLEQEGHFVSRLENGTTPSTIFTLHGGF